MRISEFNNSNYALEECRCYVGGRSGETFIREIRQIEDGRVYYTDYGLSDGGSIGEGSCTGDTFILWTRREATQDELERLHISEEHRQHKAEAAEQIKTICHQYARHALSNPEVLTDRMLVEELQRREVAAIQQMQFGPSSGESIDGFETLGRYLMAALIAHRLDISLDRAYKLYVKHGPVNPSLTDLGRIMSKHMVDALGARFSPLILTKRTQ